MIISKLLCQARDVSCGFAFGCIAYGDIAAAFLILLAVAIIGWTLAPLFDVSPKEPQ